MKKVVAVLAVVVAGAGIFAAHQWMQLRTEREQGTALTARVAALEAAQQARAAMPRVQEPVAAPVSNAQAVANQPGPAVAPETAKPAQQARQEGKPPASLMETMNTPEGRELTRSMLRGLMLQMYGDVGKELNLTPAETDNLLNLLGKHQEDLTADSMSLMGGQTSPAAMQEAQRRLIQKQQAQEAELASTLGAKYPKWQDYQSTQAARQLVTQLRTSLGATGNPLTEAQSKSLTAAFAADQKRTQQEDRAWSTSPAAVTSPNMLQEQMRRTTQNQRRLVDVAAPHLNAEQLNMYKQQVEQNVSMLGAMMGVMGGKAGTP